MSKHDLDRVLLDEPTLEPSGEFSQRVPLPPGVGQPGEEVFFQTLIEDNSGRVVVIPGDPRNMKVTFPEDLAVVRALVAAGAGQ